MCAPSGDQLWTMRVRVGLNMTNVPEPSEERSWGVVKRLLDFRLKFPIGRPPYANRPVIRAGCEELSDRIPAYTLHKPLVLVNLAQSFCDGDELVHVRLIVGATHRG